MAANAFVRARIDEDLKNQAADVLAGMGLTISDLVRITLTKVAREKALPFDLREPNQLTIQSKTAKLALMFIRPKTPMIYLIN
ncbi:type II toxin-antitoxin system RelB/DinJ family antitoxin [Escherichia coli]|nr:type II toxin-antitoxin system RelB/DinJ family antitoxin [Escherichia coli]EER3268551.1 type II toxin-antitoxin system RelB/DinJ family antitoxin [Escherichia coli]EEV3458584.1 type II toxin-antitoxin system RelB/DinJ family antitoxin [Escherichia coli]EFA1027259.1 type II toxin-antitoxin system RelB/DinJ family antitoxin [Escherichia coli]EFJ1070117.1 type II toxin-antitoxin system RelB/DinJ family antitoxin [Escherichia coli]